ncbi:MAG TPA: tetratricopeptide repeat protein [Chloroflexia bacterium]|nr:tetratricopeptide repeat protein [Chloroflexia bacterium]
MGRRPGILQRFRMLIARLSGRVDKQGNIKPREEGDTFRTIVALMIALVTILGAIVAWRSAVAGTFAGNTEDSGLLASLNLQEATTTGSIKASQHRAAHLEYFRYLQLALTEIDQANAEIAERTEITEEEIKEILRPIIENADLAITSRNFFEVRYLDENNNYDAERERAENLAEAALAKDLDPEPQFVTADQYRARSVALIATLVILAISLWLFAFAETIDKHPVKYVMALGGLVFILLGGIDAWAIEADAALPDIYRASELVSLITGVVLIILTTALVVFTLIRRRSRQPAFDPHSAPAYDMHSDPSRRNGEESATEGRFKEVVTVLIATLTLFAAVVGWLQADAGAKGDQAIRDAQRFASEALGTESTGKALVNFQYGSAYRTWEELLVEALSAETVGDGRTAERLRNVMTETLRLSEELAAPVIISDDEEAPPQETPIPAPQLMAPPYFDPKTQSFPDVSGYEADVYLTKRTELSERSRLSGDLNNIWENKANAYIVHLTLLAAALALFGLSLSFSGLARPVFVTVGTAISLVTVGSVLSVFGEPVKYIPDSAVAAYARGVGLNWRGDAHGAVAAFDEALSLSPGYANALAGRGEAHLALASPEGHIAAAKDYEETQAAGQDDAKVAWNLGWIYYLQGRFEDSIKMSRHSLELDPKQSAVRLNLAIAQLASGKIDEAKAAYRDAMSKVTQQVADIKASGKKVPPSLWFFLDAGGRDLESLFFRLENLTLTWIEAPPRETIANPEAVQQAAAEMFRDLKSLIASLENTGRAPEGEVSAVIGAFQFGAKSSTDQEEYSFAESFPSPVKEIVTKYSFEGMQNGQTVQWKVFLNGYERPEYRIKYVWDKGESGEAEQVFGEEYSISNVYSFDPGDYIVEMYVDNLFAQISSFDIQPYPTSP